MTRRLRILMLFHVDWNWIWQRPQALASGLAAQHDVRVIYRLNPYRKRLVRHPRGPSRWPLVPVPERAMPRLARAIHRAEISLLATLSPPDVLWLTHPDLCQAVPPNLWKFCKVVYDCMDLAAGFAVDRSEKAALERSESDLLRRADLVLCSSEALVRTVRTQATTGHIALLENALDDRWITFAQPERRTAKRSSINAWYFGTISHWIDWNLIAHSLDQRPSLRINMVGPIESPPPIDHPHLRLYAPVEHARLPAVTGDADVFLLPFLRNDLVDHVNPVKLYEYLALGRPVIAVDYPETRKFLPWVSLYSSPVQFVALLDKVVASDRQDPTTDVKNVGRQQFIKANTWSSRVAQVNKMLESITTLRQ